MSLTVSLADEQKAGRDGAQVHAGEPGRPPDEGRGHRRKSGRAEEEWHGQEAQPASPPSESLAVKLLHLKSQRFSRQLSRFFPRMAEIPDRQEGYFPLN